MQDTLKTTMTEKKIDNSLFSIKMGAINKFDPKVVYLTGKTYVTPIKHEMKEDDHERNIKSVEFETYRNLFNHLMKQKTYETNVVFTFDVSASGLAKNKPCYLNFELHLMQRNTKEPMPFNLLLTEVSPLVDVLTYNIYSLFSSKGYEISKTKYK